MLDLIVPDLCDFSKHIGALSTGRSGGVSNAPFDDGLGLCKNGLNLGLNSGDEVEQVIKNRLLLRAHLPAEPVWLNQVHGADVIDAASVKAGEAIDADASFTAEPGVVCVVTTADCLPVLFCDGARKIVAAAHAGWRGLAAGVLQNTVKAMQQAGAKDIHAWLGPAIGPKRFEVGAEVYQVFVDLDLDLKQCFTRGSGFNGKYFADLHGIAKRLLNRCGVSAITGVPFCTASEPARFYSYRRDGVTGRMASLIWIK